MKVLLYSGGMDSWLIRQLWRPDKVVYVNMHTKYSEEEIKRLDDEVIVKDFPLTEYEREDKIIPLRNLYLVMVICNMFPEGDLDICLGATAGDRVLDKSFEFAQKTSELLTYLYSPQHWIPNGRKVNVNIDFKSKTKTEILKEYIQNGGDIQKAFNQSFSCYNPVDDHPCWACKPCFRKFVSFAMNGYDFPQEILTKVIPYIKKEILPQINAGTYGRKEEEVQLLEILKKYEDCN